MKKYLIGALALGASVFVSQGASAESAAGFSSGGYVYPIYNSPGVALLDSFYFRYNDTDHHLSSLSVKPESNGTIMLAFADHNNDDDYYYTVEHKRNTSAGIITGSFVDFCTGSCLYPLAAPGPGYVFALRGFRFYYRNGDHHMNQVGILREATGVRTFFNDHNTDDPYTVYVDYAWLPSSLVEYTGVISGTDDGGGVQRAVTNANRAIITGFKMDYVYGGDHELQEIGVLTRNSDIQVYYGDSNGDDDFTYQVNYAVMRQSLVIGQIGPIGPIGPIAAVVSP